MTASLARDLALTEAAHRHCAALKDALAKGLHDCWCGEFGCFGFNRKWFCEQHVTKDADGWFQPIEETKTPPTVAAAAGI